METAISFLKKLKTNNNREWFEANKEKYIAAKEEYESFVRKLTLQMSRQSSKNLLPCRDISVGETCG